METKRGSDILTKKRDTYKCSIAGVLAGDVSLGYFFDQRQIFFSLVVYALEGIFCDLRPTSVFF